VPVATALNGGARPQCRPSSASQLVATLRLDSVIVVATEEAIIVADRSRAQDARQVLSRIEQHGLDALTREKVHRPWGAYQSVTQGDQFQVKLITVKPGGRLSLWLHHHRAEHWVVVEGYSPYHFRRSRLHAL
jgi:mannose-1-phosphate guanylyltransferase/mannose-6-phosphate isomerase